MGAGQSLQPGPLPLTGHVQRNRRLFWGWQPLVHRLLPWAMMPGEGRTDYSVLFGGDTWFCKKLKKKKKKSWKFTCACVFLEALAQGLQGSFPHLLAIRGAGSHHAVLALSLQLLPHRNRPGWGWERVTATWRSVLSLGKDRCEHLREKRSWARSCGDAGEMGWGDTHPPAFPRPRRGPVTCYFGYSGQGIDCLGRGDI